MEKLTTTDYEAVIEGCMLAGTHWFNVAPHEMGMSAHDQDVMHVEYMVVHERRKAWLVSPAMWWRLWSASRTCGHFTCEETRTAAKRRPRRRSGALKSSAKPRPTPSRWA